MMSKINLFYSCKKSYKPCAKKPRCDQVVPLLSKDNFVEDNPLGYFDQLPIELKFFLFSKLTALDLSYLTITSKAMRNLVEMYRKSEKGSKNLFIYPLIHSQPIPVDEQKYLEQFRDIGLLLKRSTCLYSTKDRLLLILSFLNKFQCNWQKECTSTHNCVALTCYGVVLHTVIAGWDDKECIKTFETVCQISHMNQFLDYVIKKNSPNLSCDVEMQVRYFFRRVFFNNANKKSEKAFWLNILLKPFPIVNQARIIYMLFGPSSKDGVQWFEVCESTPTNKEQTLLCFGNISNALLLLNSNCPEWTDDDVINVFNELIAHPEEWLTENIASLLFLLGESITLKILSSKAINGRITELSYLISSLCLVCSKQNSPLTWIINIIVKLILLMDSTKSRKNFLFSIIDMFREVTYDVFDIGEAEALDDESLRDLHILLNSQAAFSKELMLLAFKHLLPE